ncbi:MAG: Peptidoglycan glycosyltransferase [candidate division WWE3 bacterium GW2011_GWE1_41_27]|uniref:Peptidoglycan glycosyltransferase n=2 Tax=Katanobacteria TaxID=422282 RepID=A0A0G1ADK8_UNCKA|nr:MAG: Peptidoglycan glycosyltransferase [candidate division WWE3 bacterium GW2011_GWE1_41_27]KKS59120.1 MAG: Peptidoglycan glycosyltransferase [candidate division WWE3 bacterium GW2011_GWF2_42_42]
MGFFFLGFLAVVLRLFQIQVLGHEKFEKMGQDQYWTFQEIYAGRGNISSADGYLLAGTVDNYLMYGEPKVVDNKTQTAHTLAEYLASIEPEPPVNAEGKAAALKPGFDYFYKSIFDSLNLDLFWVPLKRNLSHEQMLEIQKFGIVGIGFEKEPKRYYPEGMLASHVLGFVASDEKGEKTGYYGIEGALNEDLQGKSGRILEEKDATGNPILAGGYRKSNPLPGRDIVLTIDRSVQYMVERMIKEGVEKYDAVSGNVIVMDPYTGKVIAMANYPTYDPSDFSVDDSEMVQDGEQERKKAERRNLSIQQTYEPGSVMKPMTVSAAVDLGLVTSTTTFDDAGPVYYSDYKVDNWDLKHHGVITVQRLLELSNNIGAAWVGHKVGTENLRSYLANFGYGKKTGIELQGEDTGILLPVSDWSDIALANISFGQGISATPLQVLNAFNVIANGGSLYQPLIISELDDGKKVLEMQPKKIRKVISQETAQEMVAMLENAAVSGEAKFYVLKDYKIAGKTGTAQIPEKGGYSADKTNATFVGFLSGARRISMIVKLEEPKTSVYASMTSVPLWMDIMSELVKSYGIAPDRIQVEQVSQSN